MRTPTAGGRPRNGPTVAESSGRYVIRPAPSRTLLAGPIPSGARWAPSVHDRTVAARRCANARPNDMVQEVPRDERNDDAAHMAAPCSSRSWPHHRRASPRRWPRRDAGTRRPARGCPATRRGRPSACRSQPPSAAYGWAPESYPLVVPLKRAIPLGLVAIFVLSVGVAIGLGFDLGQGGSDGTRERSDTLGNTAPSLAPPPPASESHIGFAFPSAEPAANGGRGPEQAVVPRRFVVGCAHRS